MDEGEHQHACHPQPVFVLGAGKNEGRAVVSKIDTTEGAEFITSMRNNGFSSLKLIFSIFLGLL